MTIDGTTQPGFDATTDQNVIEIQYVGTIANVVNGLTISAGNTTVKNITVQKFTGDGIMLYVGGGNTITGCMIGTNEQGLASVTANGTVTKYQVSHDGIEIYGSSNNVIGGTGGLTTRNVIAGASAGVDIGGYMLNSVPQLSQNNVVAGNFIGLDYLGVNPNGDSSQYGVYLNALAQNNSYGTSS